MEPLFTVKYNKTLKDIRAFNWYASRKLTLITILIGIVLNILQMEKGHNILWIMIYLAVTTIIWVFFVIVLNILVLYISTGHSWKTNSSPTTGTISFYEDKFIDEDGENTITKYYDKLYRINETNDYFYLMNASNNGFIVSKNICSHECIDFLKRKKAEIKH